MQELTNDYGHECYFGQVNEKGQKNGIGRLCRISGEIYEGSFKEDQYHGYGRELTHTYNYTGMYHEGMIVERDQIEWVTSPDESFFDQTLLMAKKEMTQGLQAFFAKKVKNSQKVASYSHKRKERLEKGKSKNEIIEQIKARKKERKKAEKYTSVYLKEVSKQKEEELKVSME